MPRSTSFDRVCFPKAIMACDTRRRSAVCAVQTRLCHATPDVIIPCVLSKGGFCHATLDVADRVCSPRAVMSCDARRRSTMCVVQGQ